MAAAGCVEALTARAEQHAAGLPRAWVATLTLDPAITRQRDPDALLHGARDAWHADRAPDPADRPRPQHRPPCVGSYKGRRCPTPLPAGPMSYISRAVG